MTPTGTIAASDVEKSWGGGFIDNQQQRGQKQEKEWPAEGEKGGG